MNRRRRVTVPGLVGWARRARAELASAPASVHADRMRRRIREQLDRVEQELIRARLTTASLSPAMRCAYLFLKQIEAGLRATPANGARPERTMQGEAVAFSGLRSTFSAILDALSRAGPYEAGELFTRIGGVSRHIERLIEHQGLKPERLRPDQRAMRGWLAYFAQREHFGWYLEALARASQPLTNAARKGRRHETDLRLFFRPMRGVYAVTWRNGVSRVSLPTPMICFETGLFVKLAEQMFGAARRDGAVLERMQATDYRTIEADLDRLAGPVVTTSGWVHDLSDSFERVNQRYFDGAMPRPRLAWSRSMAGCKFGHYDFTTDEIQISPMLDTPDVPAFVVDFVMYHELLHKRFGLRWSNGRGAAHTPVFRREERRFERFNEAEAALNRLAAALRR